MYALHFGVYEFQWNKNVNDGSDEPTEPGEGTRKGNRCSMCVRVLATQMCVYLVRSSRFPCANDSMSFLFCLRSLSTRWFVRGRPERKSVNVEVDGSSAIECQICHFIHWIIERIAVLVEFKDKGSDGMMHRKRFIFIRHFIFCAILRRYSIYL